MGDRVREDEALEGIGIPDVRVGPEALTAVGTGGAGSPDSAYTQVGAGPGQAVSDDDESKLTIEVSNGQTVPFEVEVRTAGLPGKTGLGVLWREQSSATADDWRSRDEAQLLDRWAAVRWSDTLNYPKFELLVDPHTQQLVCLSARDVSDTIETALFDWNAAEWVASNDASEDTSSTTLGVFSLWGAVTGVVLPSGRALALGVDSIGQLRVFATDNLVDWSSYADVAGTVAATTDGATMAEYRRDLLLLTVDGGDVQQLVSNSLGTTFAAVGAAVLAFGFDLHARPLPNNGGIIVGYRRASDSRPAVRVLSSASQPLSGAAEVLVDAAAAQVVTDLGLEVDDNGTVYVLGRPSVGGGSRTADEVVVWTSTDGGATFAIQLMALHVSGDVQTAPVNLTCRFCRGWLVTAHQWVANPGNEGNSIGTMWSAGWDNRAVLDFWPQTWMPLDLPADIGAWVNLGATLPTLAPPGVMEFAIVASTGFVELDPADASASVFFDHRIDSGTPALGLLENGAALRRANGVTDFRLQVRIGAAAVRLFDTNAAAPIGADITLDSTVWRQWTMFIDSVGRAFVFYRDLWDTRWVAALYEHQLTDGGAGPATNRIRAGSAAGTPTVTSHWRRLDDGKGAFPVIGLRLPTATGNKALPLGAPLSSFPNAVPELGGADPDAADLIAGTATAPRATYLAATRGPGRRGETFTIDPFFSRGVQNLLPRKSPSPSQPFEALNTDELRFVFDFGEPTRLGVIWHLFVGLLGVNFAGALLEGSTNGTAWTLLGTYNGAAGFEGLTYDRVGDYIRPRPGTAPGARHLQRNSLAPYGPIADRAGYAVVDLGGTPTALPVLGNGPGVWADPSTPDTLYTEVRLGGDVASTPATGTCDLVFPDGVLLQRVAGGFPTSAQFFRYFRVRVPAAQPIVGTGYRIGAMYGPGTVGVFGKRTSRGWSQGMDPNTSTTVSRFGTRRRRQLGPSLRRWSAGWADGLVLAKLRNNPSPDFLSAGPISTHPALAVRDEAWWSLWGMMEETLGWSIPVMAFNSLENADDVTITDRTRFLGGHIAVGGVQFTEILGNIDESEFGRVDPLLIEEAG